MTFFHDSVVSETELLRQTTPSLFPNECMMVTTLRFRGRPLQSSLVENKSVLNYAKLKKSSYFPFQSLNKKQNENEAKRVKCFPQGLGHIGQGSLRIQFMHNLTFLMILNSFCYANRIFDTWNHDFEDVLL